MTVLAELADSRELLVNLTLREVRGKYKRTSLGHLWSLINPLAMLLMYTAVFGLMLRIPPPAGHGGVKSYAMFLVCALLPWAFFGNTMTGGMDALVSNDNLVKKVYFRREVLVAANVLSWDLSFLIEMGVLTAVLLVLGFMPLPWLPLVLVFIVVLSAFGLGVALLLSIANVYFRDTKHFMGILVQLWFYGTPIIYPIKQVQDFAKAHGSVGETVLDIYRLNPMERFTTVFRDLLYVNHMPDWVDMVYCVGAAAVALVVGYTVFKRFEGRLAEEL